MRLRRGTFSSVGIIFSSDACKYIAENCSANIIVVEDEKQLEKVIKFKSEMTCLKVRVSALTFYLVPCFFE